MKNYKFLAVINTENVSCAIAEGQNNTPLVIMGGNVIKVLKGVHRYDLDGIERAVKENEEEILQVYECVKDKEMELKNHIVTNNNVKEVISELKKFLIHEDSDECLKEAFECIENNALEE